MKSERKIKAMNNFDFFNENHYGFLVYLVIDQIHINRREQMQ